MLPNPTKLFEVITGQPPTRPFLHSKSKWPADKMMDISNYLLAVIFPGFSDNNQKIYPLIYKKSTEAESHCMISPNAVAAWKESKIQDAGIFCLYGKNMAVEWNLQFIGFLPRRNSIFTPSNLLTTNFIKLITTDIISEGDQYIFNDSMLIQEVELITDLKAIVPEPPIQYKTFGNFIVATSVRDYLAYFLEDFTNSKFAAGGTFELVNNRLQFYKMILANYKVGGEATASSTVDIYMRTFKLDNPDIQRYTLILLVIVGIYHQSFGTFLKSCERIVSRLICKRHRKDHVCENQVTKTNCEITGHVKVLEEIFEVFDQLKNELEARKVFESLRTVLKKNIETNFGDISKIAENCIDKQSATK